MWSAFELWSECWHALRGSWPYCTIYLVQCCTPGPWSTSTWCSAFDGGYQRRQKANGQLEKTAGPPSQRLALQCPGGFRRCTAIYAVEIWDRQVSRSGATVHLDYATTTMMIVQCTHFQWCNQDLFFKTKTKTKTFLWCILKDDRIAFFIFDRNRNENDKWIFIFGRKTKMKVTW